MESFGLSRTFMRAIGIRWTTFSYMVHCQSVNIYEMAIEASRLALYLLLMIRETRFVERGLFSEGVGQHGVVFVVGRL